MSRVDDGQLGKNEDVQTVSRSPLSEPPKLDIPGHAEVGEYGDVRFQIVTGGGLIEAAVSGYGRTKDICCSSTPDTLVAAGIIDAAWIVEDRKSWCVVFDKSGPHLRIGGRGRPKGQYMKIDRYCSDPGQLRVTFPMTSSNIAAVAKLQQTAEVSRRGRHDEIDRVTRNALANHIAAVAPKRPAPACRIVGNVIYWPGRGSVSAVVPAC